MSDSNTPWVEGLTIGQVLAATAERFARPRCAGFSAARRADVVSRVLAERVDAAARGLLALGISRGEHVAVWATNVPQWVILQFATARIGAVLVTINPAYRPFELGYVLEQSDAVALFLVERFKIVRLFRDAGRGLSRAGRPPSRASWSARLSPAALGRGAARPRPPAAITWDEMLPSAARACRTSDLDDIGRAARARATPINIQYTSGTTGFPKAATLSHRNLLLNAFYVGQCQRAHRRTIAFASPCRSIIASAACWARSARWSTARR